MRTPEVNTLVIPFDINCNEEIAFEVDSAVQIVEVTDLYDGPYEVTPSSETQTLLTEDKTMGGNVVINPIPSNYGLINWNGSVLTVS